MAHYVTNEEIVNVLKSYRLNKDRKSYERLGEIFILIASNILNKSNTINYSQDRKNAMISDATFIMLTKIDNFDMDKSEDPNPFSFLTSIARNAYSKAFNDQKRYDKKFVSVDFVENMNSGSTE